MALSNDDREWLEGMVRRLIDDHEKRYHPPNGGKRVARIMGIVASAVVVASGLLGGLLWLIKHQ